MKNDFGSSDSEDDNNSYSHVESEHGNDAHCTRHRAEQPLSEFDLSDEGITGAFPTVFMLGCAYG